MYTAPTLTFLGATGRKGGNPTLTEADLEAVLTYLRAEFES